MTPTLTGAACFWSNVDKNGPVPAQRPDLGPCWLWTNALLPSGYAQASVDKVRWRIHRYSYTQLVGPIPEGYEVDHLCLVKHCVNPAHLEAVTPTENKRRSGCWDFERSKTHCPQGHPYDEANTYFSENGRGSVGRNCRTCHRERQRPRLASCPTCGSTDRAVFGPLCAIFGRFGAEPDAWHGGETPS